jgi:multimeric flavodoxin WrbA
MLPSAKLLPHIYRISDMILGICGSPRKATTHYALKNAMTVLNEGGHETALYTVAGKTIGYCTHCDGCLTGDGCVINDDVQDFYSLLRGAEALVIATPVYNGGVSAQLKALMDRTRALFASNRDALKGRSGVGIAVGGDRTGGQELALQQIHTFYIINGVHPVGGGVFGGNLGVALWSKDSMEGIRSDEEGHRVLGKTMKNFMKHLEVKQHS